VYARKSVREIRNRIGKWPRGLLLALLLLLLILLAYLDFVTSRFIQLSLFYALISGIVGWTLGRRAVLLVVVLATVLTFTSDRLADPSVPLGFDLANHGFRALLWTLLGFALVALRSRMNLLDDAYELICQDLESGRRVQTAFLSRPVPDDPRLDVGVAFRTARELGGDYFDIRIIQDQLQILVADVSGKGASAALVTGLLGGLFSELSRRHQDPAKVLRILDREITPSLPDGMFITAFYLTMDLENGDCSYASAGHDPQYRVSSGELEELMPTGLPLGLLEGFELDVGTFSLAVGESVVLFTDGVINVKTPNGRMGEEPFVQLLIREMADTSQILTDRIFVFLDRQGQMDDDAVVLVLRRNAIAG